MISACTGVQVFTARTCAVKPGATFNCTKNDASSPSPVTSRTNPTRRASTARTPTHSQGRAAWSPFPNMWTCPRFRAGACPSTCYAKDKWRTVASRIRSVSPYWTTTVMPSRQQTNRTSMWITRRTLVNTNPPTGFRRVLSRKSRNTQPEARWI